MKLTIVGLFRPQFSLLDFYMVKHVVFLSYAVLISQFSKALQKNDRESSYNVGMEAKALQNGNSYNKNRKCEHITHSIASIVRGRLPISKDKSMGFLRVVSFSHAVKCWCC